MQLFSRLNVIMLVHKHARLILADKLVIGTVTRLIRRNSSSLTDDTPTSEKAVQKYKSNNLFQIFAKKRNDLIEFHKLNPFSHSHHTFKKWKENMDRNYEINLQRYMEERHTILGPDLATAHFIVFRGGKVKFHGSDEWIEKEEGATECKELPTKYVRNLYLECVDSSNTKIRYEGLVNFTDLKKLKWLSFRNCEFVDDWFIDRISGEFSNSLEYLDISDCTNVTQNGLNCLYRLRKLKKLVVHNIDRNLHFQYSCLLLEDSLPGLSIEGLKYLEINSQ